MKLSSIICIVTLIIGTTWEASSQKTWTLQECITYALENSLALQQNSYTNQIDQINLTQAKKRQNPSLSFNSNLNLQLGRNINIITNLPETVTAISNGLSLNSNIPIFNGFQIKNTIEQSRLNEMASKEDLESNKSNIALNVATAYLNALGAKETLKDNEATLALTQEQLNRIDRLINAGSVPKNDRLNILAQVSGNEQQIIASQNRLDIALLTLQQSMNYRGNEEMKLQDLPDITLEEDPFLLQYEELYQDAKANFLRSNDLRYESAKVGIDIAKGAKYPSLNGSAGVSTNYFNSNKFDDDSYFNQVDDQLGYFVGLNLNVPIFDNYTSQAGIERAKVNLAITENQNDQSEQQLRSNVQQVLTDARFTKKQMESAAYTVEAQKAAFENAEKRFELGAINSYDLVNANNQYNSAKINYIIAKYDYLFKMKILDIYRGKPVSLD